MKEETKKCEKENMFLTKDFNDTQKKVEELDTKMHDAQEEYERLYNLFKNNCLSNI